MIDASSRLPLPSPTGFLSGAAAGLLAGAATLLAMRGAIHLRSRPTVLPIQEAPAAQLAVFLLAIGGGGLGRTHGWALQFGLGLLGVFGGRYVTFPADCQIEVVGLDRRQLDEAITHVLASVWASERDLETLGPVPLVVVSESRWEPRTFGLTVNPSRDHLLSIVRFGLARRLAGQAVKPHPIGIAFLAVAALVAYASSYFLG